MSLVTSARVAVIQDVQTLCIHYWVLAFPSLFPLLDGTTAVPKWISNERICQGLFAAGLDLMLLLYRWRDCLNLQNLKWLVDNTSPKAFVWWHQSTSWTNSELILIRGKTPAFTFFVSPSKTTSSTDLSGPCLVFCNIDQMSESFSNLDLSLQPDVPHSFFAHMQLYS